MSEIVFFSKFPSIHMSVHEPCFSVFSASLVCASGLTSQICSVFVLNMIMDIPLLTLSDYNKTYTVDYDNDYCIRPNKQHSDSTHCLSHSLYSTSSNHMSHLQCLKVSVYDFAVHYGV